MRSLFEKSNSLSITLSITLSPWTHATANVSPHFSFFDSPASSMASLSLRREGNGCFLHWPYTSFSSRSRITFSWEKYNTVETGINMYQHHNQSPQTPQKQHTHTKQAWWKPSLKSTLRIRDGLNPFPAPVRLYDVHNKAFSHLPERCSAQMLCVHACSEVKL